MGDTVDFWDAIEAQLKMLESAKSADDVIKILGNPSAGDAFFAGSGGDGSVYESLSTAGWSVVWWEAGYHWCMRAPDGSKVTYVEGDIYRGNSLPITDTYPPIGDLPNDNQL